MPISFLDACFPAIRAKEGGRHTALDAYVVLTMESKKGKTSRHTSLANRVHGRRPRLGSNKVLLGHPRAPSACMHRAEYHNFGSPKQKRQVFDHPWVALTDARVQTVRMKRKRDASIDDIVIKHGKDGRKDARTSVADGVHRRRARLAGNQVLLGNPRTPSACTHREYGTHL